MSFEELVFKSIVVIFILTATLGYVLEKKQGAVEFRESTLPIARFISFVIFGRKGSMFSLAFDPQQWKTDKKSLLLLLVGLPIGVIIMCAVAYLVLAVYRGSI